MSSASTFSGSDTLTADRSQVLIFLLYMSLLLLDSMSGGGIRLRRQQFGVQHELLTFDQVESCLLCTLGGVFNIGALPGAGEGIDMYADQVSFLLGFCSTAKLAPSRRTASALLLSGKGGRL